MSESDAVFRIVISTKPENGKEWVEKEPLYLNTKDVEHLMVEGSKVFSAGIALYLVKKLGLLRAIGL